jgi:hypothetical protein
MEALNLDHGQPSRCGRRGSFGDSSAFTSTSKCRPSGNTNATSHRAPSAPAHLHSVEKRTCGRRSIRLTLDRAHRPVLHRSNDVRRWTTNVPHRSNDVGRWTTDVPCRSTDVPHRSNDVHRWTTNVLHRSSDLRRWTTNVLHRSTDVLHRSTDVLHRSTDVLHRSTDVLHRSTDVLHRSTDVLSLVSEDHARTLSDLFRSNNVLHAWRRDDTRTRLDLQGPTDVRFLSETTTKVSQPRSALCPQHSRPRARWRRSWCTATTSPSRAWNTCTRQRFTKSAVSKR